MSAGCVPYARLSLRILTCDVKGLFEASLTDYRAATVLGSDPALVADVERLGSLAECDTLKKQADARFGVGNITEAVKLYTTALSLEPSFVSCISNRAVRVARGGLGRCESVQ